MYIRSLRPIAQFVSILLLALSAHAQLAAIPLTGHAGLDQYRASRVAIFTDDFGELMRYRGDNGSLRAMPLPVCWLSRSAVAP
jgi:hypothetical protein